MYQQHFHFHLLSSPSPPHIGVAAHNKICLNLDRLSRIHKTFFTISRHLFSLSSPNPPYTCDLRGILFRAYTRGYGFDEKRNTPTNTHTHTHTHADEEHFSFNVMINGRTWDSWKVALGFLLPSLFYYYYLWIGLDWFGFWVIIPS